MLLAHKTRVYLTNKQKQYIEQAFGVRRFTYNNLVEYFNNSESIPTKKDYAERVKQLRNDNDWMLNFSTRVARNTIDDISSAVKKAFSKEVKAKRLSSGKHWLGFPKFSKKGVNESFSIREKEKFKITNRRLRFEKLPKNLGSIKLQQKPRFEGIAKQITFSKKNNQYFVSILIDTNDIKPLEPNGKTVGVDMGIKELAVLSDGKVFSAVRSFKSKEKKLAKLQRQLSKKQHSRFKGDKTPKSNNYIKQQKKVTKLHYYVSEARKESLHILTKYLINNYETIAIEDLNVSGMLKNKRLSKAIADVGFYEFRRQLEYKSKMYNREIFIVDRFFPSSKTCSKCGNVKNKLALSERTYFCEECNLKIDRDLNASINLKKVATRSRETINACGDSSLEPSGKHELSA